MAGPTTSVHEVPCIQDSICSSYLNTTWKGTHPIKERVRAQSDIKTKVQYEHV